MNKHALYSARKIALEIGVTKDTIHKWKREGKIPKPAYSIDNVEGWSASQFESIKKGVNKNNDE